MSTISVEIALENIEKNSKIRSEHQELRNGILLH